MIMGARNKIILGLTAIALVAFGVGCGHAPSNNQGTAFTLLGFFSELPESGADDLPPATIGIATPLSTATETGAGFAGGISVVAGIQNNMIGQFVRTDRILLSYYVEGASNQPPDTTEPFGVLVGPAQVATAEGDTASAGSPSSLPDSFTTGVLSNNAYGEFRVVPPDIMSWISLNRASLPEAPFTMVVDVIVSGVTSSGQRIESNSSTFVIQFNPDNIISPTSGITGTDTAL